MKTAAILAALALVAAGTTPARAEDEQKAEAPAKKEPIICKKERATGSLTRVNKVCMTRTEWREFYANTKKNVDTYTSKQSGYAPQGQNPLGGN